MNVLQLKKLIDSLPDDIEVILNNNGNSFPKFSSVGTLVVTEDDDPKLVPVVDNCFLPFSSHTVPEWLELNPPQPLPFMQTHSCPGCQRQIPLRTDVCSVCTMMA